MPELPEVETTKASLAPLLGQTVRTVDVHQPKLREMMPTDLDSLCGFVLSDVRRRAKYLLLDFVQTANNRHKTLLIHLGMSGSLQQHATDDGTPNTRKHDHLVMTFGNGAGNITALHYHDPRRFGIITWATNDDFIDDKDSASERYLSHLGVEPLDDAFNGEYLHAYIWRLNQANKNSPKTPKKPITKPIKALIMEQTVVVGVGNIYAAESLFLSGIHPATPANRLDETTINHLVSNIKTILANAITQGGTTLKDFTVGNGKTGYFQQVLHVYGRDGKPCTTCGTSLANVKIAGRASVYCPTCQPLK
ncbi:MAG: bifunctional DNA-formamidopyrimidine glycosylase/DNA-(apurinic or apyrimidinic site) lyase [Moraxella sp.]|nr:bifunctional DNA-formamidopyrimidine glycosylase/DNA-(apurinic or apyrimidinic site) lyase [Moraxella sp.]